MSITRIECAPRMSQAVIHNGLVYTAGQVAKGDSVTAQTEAILANIDRLLSEAGTDKSKLLSATIWITDMTKFAELNAVWDAWVAPSESPARACTQAVLALPEFQVEIMVIAAL